MKNKTLFFAGLLTAVLWAFVTAISQGIPLEWCRTIDQLTLGFISEAVFAMANGFYYDVPNNDMPTLIFLGIFFLNFILTVWVYLRIEKKGAERHTLGLVVFFALIFRIILLPSELIHENDIYRYLWDGKSANHGINPYKYAPADLFMFENGISEDYYDSYHDVTVKGKSFSDQDSVELAKLIQLRDFNPVYFERIGHPQVPTIYPPVMQGIFAFLSWLKEDSILLMKSFFVLFDLGVVALIVAMLRHFRKETSLCVLYAWSPLVLKEFAIAGHYDPVVIFFTLLGILFFLKGQWVRTIASWAIAFLCKFFTVTLIPLGFRRLKWKGMLLFLAMIIAAYIPFIRSVPGIPGVFQGLITYGEEWAYNGSLFAFIHACLKQVNPAFADSLIPAKMIAGILYLGFLTHITRGVPRNDMEFVYKCFLAIAALFILNPVGDPWYYCWVIPFLCLLPKRSWILLSGLLVLSYLNFRSDIAWMEFRLFHIPVLNWVIYLPFFVILIWETLRKRKGMLEFS